MLYNAQRCMTSGGKLSASVLRSGFQELKPLKYYWLKSIVAAQLSREAASIEIVDSPDADRFDTFGTANFFNFEAWIEAIRLISEVGLENIEDHDLALASTFAEALDDDSYRLRFIPNDALESPMIFVEPTQSMDLPGIEVSIARCDVHVAIRTSHIRISPHFYNTRNDVLQAAHALNELRP